MKEVDKRIISVAVIIILVLGGLSLVHIFKRELRDGTVAIKPAAERELTEKDRMILRAKIAAAFPEWIGLWWPGDTRRDLSWLERDSIEEIDTSLIIREDHVYMPVDDAALLSLVSPDRTKFLEYEGGIETDEPDTELTLIDAVRHERRRLLFYGPSVRFDGAAWADNETVVAIGSSDAHGESSTAVIQPLVWIFHLSHNVVSTYTTTRR